MLHMTSTRTHTEKHAHPNARIYDANNFPYHAHSPTHTHIHRQTHSTYSLASLYIKRIHLTRVCVEVAAENDRKVFAHSEFVCN